MTLQPLSLDVHESWIDMHGQIETTAAWRFFNLRSWVDADSYETLLRYFLRDDCISASQILDVLCLAAEAVTRSGTGARRCTTSDVQWARRTGLALFGAALRDADDSRGQDMEGATRLLLPYLPNGEREMALLALPRECQGNHLSAPLQRNSRLSNISTDKIDRLLGLCRSRVTRSSSGEHSS
jgi:hypothetical protein